MSGAVYRPYPAQQPKRYDASLFAPADAAYLQGPKWDLRAAFRREDPAPQLTQRGVAVFQPAVTYVPPALRQQLRTDAPAPIQSPMEPQAALLTPADPTYLQGPKWDLRAAMRREEPRPQLLPAGLATLIPPIAAFVPAAVRLQVSTISPTPLMLAQPMTALLFDDLAIVVGADPVHPAGAYLREVRALPLKPQPVAALFAPPPAQAPAIGLVRVSSPEARPLPLVLTGPAVFNTPLSPELIPVLNVLRVRAPEYPTQTLVFPIAALTTPADPAFIFAGAKADRAAMVRTDAQIQLTKIVQPPAAPPALVPPSAVLQISRSADVSLQLQAPRLISTPAQQVPPTTVLGVYARLAFPWPQISADWMAVFADAPVPPTIPRTGTRIVRVRAQVRTVHASAPDRTVH